MLTSSHSQIFKLEGGDLWNWEVIFEHSCAWVYQSVFDDVGRLVVACANSSALLLNTQNISYKTIKNNDDSIASFLLHLNCVMVLICLEMGDLIISKFFAIGIIYGVAVHGDLFSDGYFALALGGDYVPWIVKIISPDSTSTHRLPSFLSFVNQSPPTPSTSLFEDIYYIKMEELQTGPNYVPLPHSPLSPHATQFSPSAARTFVHSETGL